MPTFAPPKVRLRPEVTCPHCWHVFAPEQILWVAEHDDLLGDPLLDGHEGGQEHKQRFLPTRFTVEGNALDPRGFTCHQLACPRCHLVVPRHLLEYDPLFMSILGAPGSGKSYFLTAMTWELRRLLPLEFKVSFVDADPTLNQTLISYEENLFLNQQPESESQLTDLIVKTVTADDPKFYDFVRFGNQTVRYVRPCMFAMRPEQGHPRSAQAELLARTLCLYDNAGEHFQPGSDTTNSPVTRHLALSKFLLYVFDPTQDPRFRSLVQQQAGREMQRDPMWTGKPQVPVLHEAAARIRRFANLPQGAKHDKPLIVVLTKFDQWSHLLKEHSREEPWLHPANASVAAIELEAVEKRSAEIRELMRRVSPEIVGAAEAFVDSVTYIPVSALGWNTHLNREGVPSIRPAEAQPYGVTLPLLYALAKWQPGLILGARRKGPADKKNIGKVNRG